MSPREFHSTNAQIWITAFFRPVFVSHPQYSLTPAAAGSAQIPRLTRVADLSLATVRP